MDTHYQLPIKTPSGHENQGVHVCRKCGWPFPKLHPSSKHRRAHKRICGTIEGYKLTNLSVSDDEQDHPSDEDCKTPSPKIEKRSIGVGEKSYRSEDEMFSDAVAEFSDSGISPGSEEQLEDVKELEKNVQRTVVDDDIYSTGTLKVDAVSDSAKPMSSLSADNIVPSNGFVESTQSGKDNAEMSNHDLSLLSAPVENTEATVNAVQIEGYLVQDMIAGSSSKLSEIHGTNIEEKEATHVQSVANDLPLVEDADMLKDTENQKMLKSEFPLVLGTVDVKRILNEDNKDMPEGQSIEPAKTLTELECERAEHDLFHLSGSGKQEASAGTVHVEVDPTQDEEFGTHGDSVEICDTNREIEETTHVLSVASDLPIIDHADLMLQDFKDHRIFKSGFPPMGSENVIRSLEGDNEVMVIEESPFNLHSVKLGSASHSSADMDDMEEDMITIEGPDKGLADRLKSSVTTGETLESDDLEAPPSTAKSERENIQTICSLQGVEPHYEASHMESPDNDEVSQTTILSDNNSSNHNVVARAEEVVTEGNENSEGVTRKEHSAEANTILVYEDSNQTSKLTRQNNGGEHVDVTMNFSDEAWIEDSAEAAAVDKFSTSTMTNLEPEHELSSSNYSASIPDTPVSIFNTSISATIMLAHPSSRNFSDNVFQEVTTEPELNSENGIVLKCVDGGIVDSKFSQSGDVEVAEDNSKRPMRKEPETLPIHSKISYESSPDIITGNEIDGVFEKMQESDVKLTRQPSGASAINLSADLSSQIESVEGNWESVSVHNAQSDQPASAGIIVQPKTDPEGPDKIESTNLHQEIASERQNLHKADVFEPPSFMTLVEPRGGSDQNNATSEIETVQATQQPKSEVIQTGWLPSLSNVVNESPGRKKNEEIIAKVTNWSTGKQHSTPLKNLLGEAKVGTRTKSPSPKRIETNVQKDATEAKSNVSSATTVKEVLGSEAPAGDRTVKGVTAEEWNSPARYPAEIKKEKKKANGKTFWVPFACCSSVN